MVLAWEGVPARKHPLIWPDGSYRLGVGLGEGKTLVEIENGDRRRGFPTGRLGARFFCVAGTESGLSVADVHDERGGEIR